MQARSRTYGYAISVGAVALATVLFLPLRARVDFAHLAWLYLVVVGLVAWSAGTRPALVAAVTSFVAGNYFFTPPYGTFNVGSAIDLLQLVVFLIGAASIGVLTGKVREREMAALESERVSAALARLAADMAQGRDLDAVVDTASAHLMSVPGVETVVVWLNDAEKGLVAKGQGARLVSQADRDLALRSFEHVKAINLITSAPDSDRLGSGWPAVEADQSARGFGTFIPLVAASENEGVLQLVGGIEGLSPATSALAVSISHLVAVFISSLRAVETAARVQGAEEAARVKSVIVSAVSHELKTPLAAAMAGVTDLADNDVERDPADVRRALHSVEEDLQRLQSAISDLLDLSRLQSDEWMPHPESYDAGEIFGDVVSTALPAVRERLAFDVGASAPAVYADFVQVSRALRAVLDNAIAYSPEGMPIVMGAESRGDRTALWIEDRGSGVSDEDKPFIFDRAYRGSAGARRPGSSGLGLTIARDLVEANHGTLTVEDALPNGTRIVVEVPATASEKD
jgi:two-component system sensor histidine kinase KdpD